MTASTMLTATPMRPMHYPRSRAVNEGVAVRKPLLVVLALFVLAGIGCFFFYPRHRPQYCWLTFGPEANRPLLIRLDGNAVSIERYDEGQSVQNVARFDGLEDCKDVPIPAMDGNTVYIL